MWGCITHWYALPKFFRDAVWRFYVPRQEITKSPSRAYVEVARLIQLWIEAKQARINDTPGGRLLTKDEMAKFNAEFIAALDRIN